MKTTKGFICALFIGLLSCKVNNNETVYTSIEGVWSVQDIGNILVRKESDTSISVAFDYSEECPWTQIGDNNYTSKNSGCPNETSGEIQFDDLSQGSMKLSFDRNPAITHISNDTSITKHLKWFVKHKKYVVWGSDKRLGAGSINTAFSGPQSDWVLIGEGVASSEYVLPNDFKYISISFSGGIKWNIDQVAIDGNGITNIMSSNLKNCLPSFDLEKTDKAYCLITNSGYLSSTVNAKKEQKLSIVLVE